MNRKALLKTLALVALTAVLAGTVVYGALVFRLEKPMYLSVVMDYKIELYWDKECTNPVINYNFTGVYVEGESVETPTFFLKNVGKRTIMAYRDVTSPTLNFTFIAYFGSSGGSVADLPWTNTPSKAPHLSSGSQSPCRFILSIGSNPEADYELNLRIDSMENE